MKPRIITKCTANYYAGPQERIIEYSNGKAGGLISFRNLPGGKLLVTCYRHDKEVKIKKGAPNSFQ